MKPTTQVRGLQVGRLAVDEVVRDDADDLAARRGHHAGHLAHQAEDAPP
jgi:hypothetical protein